MAVRILAVTEQGAGIGSDLTDEAEALSWSSVNQGGDETCTFTLKRSWFANSPDLERGNLLRILDGVDVLWQGRIEETDRSGDTTEEIAVTAYGLGARLKDQTMREVYVDPDLSRWQAVSRAKKISELEGGWSIFDFAQAPDTSTGLPALLLQLTGAWTNQASCEAYYDAGEECLVARIYFDTQPGAKVDGSFNAIAAVADDDLGSDEIDSGGVESGVAGYFTPSEAKRWAKLQLRYPTSSGSPGFTYTLAVRKIRVYGAHGLPLQGDDPGGLLVSQIIANAIGRAEGVVLRCADPTTYVSEQAVYLDPTKIEDVISDQHRFEAHRRTWGTWGPNSPLDYSIDGYFDYTSLDAEPTWIAYREECDTSGLHSETAKLFDTVEVKYADNSGVQKVLVRSREVPELNGMHRTESVDGGKLTEAGADALAEATLALNGSFAPARGQVVFSQPIRHRDRGLLPAHYMRADGASFRIPNILSSRDLFALDSTPDRRTTFPIKRVSVDASSKANPVATAEIDQGNDAISALTARLAQEAEVRGG